MRRALGIGACILAMLAICMAGATAASATSYGVMGWGENFYGQLGNGNYENRSSPFILREPTNVTQLSGGGEFSLALLEGGSVESWGSNLNDALGNGTSGSTYNRPAEVKGVSRATAVSAGGSHGLALLEGGHVKSWGLDNYGQLGLGTTENRTEAVEISGLSGVSAVAAGGEDSFALLTSGHVKAWGENGQGQLGDGTMTGPEECSSTPCSKTPVEVLGLEEVAQVATGGDHALALLKDGHVMAWGRNDAGQLGDGTTTNRDEPVEVAGLSKVVAVSAGLEYSLALLENGTVVAWGTNWLGQLGDGSEGPEKCSGEPCSVKPVEVSGLTKVTAISAGEWHGLALLEAGTVKAWGENAQGELGDGKNKGPEKCGMFACSRTPVAVNSITHNTVGISAGNEFSLAWGPPGPIVNKLTPTNGPPTGGTTVTIAGYNLTGASEVKFGSTAATKFTVVSASEISAEAPAGAGSVHVTVTVPGAAIPVGKSSSTFRYSTPEAPEFGRCLEVAKGTGKYTTATCTSEGAEGSFEWKAGVERAGFTLVGGEGVLETVGKEKIVCTSAAGGGEYGSPKSVIGTTIKLKGCEHAGSKCTSAGAVEGELVTNLLEGEIGFTSKTSTVGLALSPSEGGSFVEGKCATTRVEVSGSVIGRVEGTNEMLKLNVFAFVAKEGKQKQTSIGGGPTEILEMLFAGGKVEQTGLSLSLTQTNEEKVEVNTVI